MNGMKNDHSVEVGDERDTIGVSKENLPAFGDEKSDDGWKRMSRKRIEWEYRTVSHGLMGLLLCGCAGVKREGILGLEPDQYVCRESLVGRKSLAEIVGNREDTAFSPLIPFKSGSSILLPAAAIALDSIADFLKTGETGYFVAVHSDKNGPPDLIEDLSRKRSVAIVTYLIGKGVQRERLTAVGAGSKCFIGIEDNPEDQMKNRRVEFIAR